MTTAEPFLVAGVRTAVGRYCGVLAEVRPGELAAVVVAQTVARRRPARRDRRVILGAANQAGEDNRAAAHHLR